MDGAGELCAGDAVPDVLLGSLWASGDDADTSLAAVLAPSTHEHESRPTLLVAGSYS